MNKIVVSGGFDPLHTGHIRMLKEAAEWGNLTIILNSDRFLKEKKGYIVMPFKERKEILESVKWVDKVVPCIDKDQTVCKTLEKLKPDIFANGGDRKKNNIPELEVCQRLGIHAIFKIGGKKIKSSSKIYENFNNGRSRIRRKRIS